MVDLQETPAVPPMDPGGDDRLGLFLAGGLLLVLGWGFAIAFNVLVHLAAPSSGTALGPVRVTTTFGLPAEITIGVGFCTGLVGAGLLWLGRQTAPGPIVLPGQSY